MSAKGDVSATVSFSVALCEALGLNPNDVQSLSLHLEGGAIKIEAQIWPTRGTLEKGRDALPALKHFRLVEVEDDAT